MQQTPKQIKAEQRSMMWAMILVIAVLFGFQYFSKPAPVAESERVAANVETSATVAQAPTPLAEKPAKHSEKSVVIKSESLNGAIALNGGVFDALTLTKYKQTIAADSANVALFNKDYAAYLKWSGNVALPAEEADWSLSGETLTPETPVLLSFENNEVRLKREISVDENYMFTVVDTLENLKNQPISVALNGVIERKAEEELNQIASVHTGFVGVINNRLEEEKYDAAEDETIAYQTTGGWFGMTDKYWQSILIPEQNEKVTYESKMKDGFYYATFKTDAVTVQPKAILKKKTMLFAGAKDLDLINAYQKDLNIPKFDLSIDFGWFYFLTKPFLYFLQWLFALFGNMGVAILVFATLLRLALLPVATKSYISMAKMKKIQPKLQDLQERYKNDRMRLQQEMMALYKREKVNPAGGCLPMLIQIPVFFALYKVLSVSLQMRQAPFFGWMQDLSAPDASSVFTLFGLVPWPIPSFLNLGVMPILMGLTMYIQQKMSPQPAGADKAQMNMFKYMPIVFTFMMGQFAVGLILYWTWSNILSIAQQKYITKKVG